MDQNEIVLDGKHYKTNGPVRVSNITVTPNPVIFGETNQQGDTQVMSQLVQASVTGGSGIYKGNPRTDAERSWTSRADTRYRSLLCLPPLAISMGKPSGVVTDLAISIEYRDAQYFSFADKVYIWLESTSAWSTLQTTLPGVPSDAVVYNDKLYVACGTGIAILNNAGVWSTDTDDATFLCIWDTKLWKLALVSGAWIISYSTDGLAWTDAGSYNAAGAPSQLLIYRDANGATVIYLMTETGPWLYDFANTRFLQSDVQIPRVETGHTVKATVFRDGKMYFTSGGLGMVSLQAGSTTIAAPVGLDQDDGVPEQDLGKFSGIAADFNWLIALVDSANSGESDWDWITMGGPFEGWDWSVEEGPATLRAWQGGWHILWESTNPGTPGSVVVVSGAYGKRRVYWGPGPAVYYIDMPSAVHNPRHNPNRRFAPGPVQHITPWWGYGSEPQLKVHGHFYLRASGCSPTETVTVYYATDLDDTTWTQIGPVIDSDGQHEFPVPDAAGVAANFFRFRLDLSRGADDTKTPIVEFWSSEIMRLLPATYAFGLDIDLTSDFYGRSPLEMQHELRVLTDSKLTPLMITLTYQDMLTGGQQTFYGKISRFSGEEWGGSDLGEKGHIQVSFVAPYTEDAI